jgi:transcriptional regulator with XRE-family HTH domain
MDAEPLPYRAMRLAAGLTLSAVALAVRINKGRLSIIERGVRPTDAERGRLNAFLGEQLIRPDGAP